MRAHISLVEWRNRFRVGTMLTPRAEYERIAFIAGLRLGTQFMLEPTKEV